MQEPSQPSPALPKSFLFGVATADHQCEAYDANYQDIRDIWEQRRNLTRRGRATDFWNRYPEDIELAKELGCKLFRFSLAWSRLEPEPGKFNEEAFAHYQRLIETIHAAGMEPIMTLHHFTWPAHVEGHGGMIGDDFPAIFAHYTEQVVGRLGQQVRYWITFNEPNQLVYGYIKPWWQQDYFTPPGLPANAMIEDQMDAISKLIKNLFLAHTAARTLIKQGNAGAQVGVNPMVLGLPTWLQWLIDRNVTGLHSQQDLHKQGRRFAERGLLEHGQVDVVIATLTATRERAEQVDFSEPYYIAFQKLLVPIDSAIQEPRDLAGKAVAVVKSSTSEDSIVTLLPEANARVVDTYDDALKELDSGTVSAILSDDTILLGLMQQHPARYRLLNNLPGSQPEPYAGAVAKGNPDLLEAVDAAVRNFKSSGAWASSFAHYFPGQPVPTPPPIGTRATLADINGMKPNQSTGQGPAPEANRKTVLERIKERGYLIVAVKQDVPGFGYRDPKTGELSGLEIDLARAIAQEICGNASKIVFRPVQTQERLPLLRSILRFFDPLLKLYSIISTAVTSNWWHLGMAGKLPTFLCPTECIGQQDFVGFDYYWGINTLQIHRLQQIVDAAYGNFDQAPVWSQALYRSLKNYAKLFPDKELLIIENGSVDKADGIDRASYISQHIRQVQRARDAGIKVAAYTCWSITSNREWGLKFSPGNDFGLYHIELDTDPDLKRLPTPATITYQNLIKERN
jgi:beta-glucosidase/6-phospho-beta-glucosidase/beta-galactosidase/ABC-type amino acid transport substrate-binding protein